MFFAGKKAVIADIAGSSCIWLGWDTIEGGKVPVHACSPGLGLDVYRIIPNPDDCTFQLAGGFDGWTYTQQMCLTHPDGNSLTQTHCATNQTSAIRWKLALSVDEKSLQIKTSDGTRCLNFSSGTDQASLVPCESGKQGQTLMLRDQMPLAPVSLVPTPVPTPVELSQERGEVIPVPSMHNVSGAGTGIGLNNVTQLLDVRENFSAEFAVNVTGTNGSDYLLYAIAAGPAGGGTLEVTVDGQNAGLMAIDATDRSDIYNRSGAARLIMNTGVHEVRVRNHRNPDGSIFPVQIDRFEMWAPRSKLPKFGTVHLPDANGIFRMPPGEVSSSYRMSLVGVGTDKETWDCPWTYCYNDYTVNSPTGGSYQLTFMYNSYVSISDGTNWPPGIVAIVGTQVFDDAPYLALERHANTDIFAQSSPITLTLTKGLNRIRIHHPLTRANGVLGSSPSTREVTLKPAK